jgi:hypothetical protein
MRQRLFLIRREMFLFMADGGIDPDSLAYGHVRTFMNTAIRYADGLSLTRSIVGIATIGEYGKTRMLKIEEEIASLPPSTRERLISFRSRAAETIGFYMIIKSPLGWLMIAAAAIFVVLSAIAAFLRIAWAKTWSEEIGILRRRAARQAEQETEILRCIEEEHGAGVSLAAA